MLGQNPSLPETHSAMHVDGRLHDSVLRRVRCITFAWSGVGSCQGYISARTARGKMVLPFDAPPNAEDRVHSSIFLLPSCGESSQARERPR
jgi:hypothetical protein